MPTKPTTGQRWPRGQEAIRTRTIEEAAYAYELLDVALRKLRSDPLYAEFHIAKAQTILERIQRLMTEAKQGAEPPETKGGEG